MEAEYCCKYCQDTGLYDKTSYCDCVPNNPEVPHKINRDYYNDMHDYKTIRFEAMRALGVV